MHTKMAGKLTPENELLLLCSRRWITPAALRQILSLLSGRLDWTDLTRLAIIHGTMPLLVRALSLNEINWHHVPPSTIHDLKEQFRLNALRNLEGLRRYLAVEEEMTRRDVETLLFKGPALALSAYGSITLRQYSDIDFFVRERDVESACIQLSNLGFWMDEDLSGREASELHRAIQCEYLFRSIEDDIVIELHWAIAPRCMAVPIDYEGLFRRMRTIAIGGKSIRALSQVDELLIVCVHGSKHHWTALKWIADTAALAESLDESDWCDILKRAGECGCERMVLVGLSLARSLLGLELPEHVLREMSQRHVTRLTALTTKTLFASERPYSDVPSPFRVTQYRFTIRERNRDKLTYVMRTIMTPPPTFLQFIYLPRGLRWLYLIIKPGHDYVLLPIYKCARLLLGRFGSWI